MTAVEFLHAGISALRLETIGLASRGHGHEPGIMPRFRTSPRTRENREPLLPGIPFRRHLSFLEAIGVGSLVVSLEGYRDTVPAELAAHCRMTGAGEHPDENSATFPVALPGYPAEHAVLDTKVLPAQVTMPGAPGDVVDIGEEYVDIASREIVDCDPRLAMTRVQAADPAPSSPFPNNRAHRPCTGA